MAEDNVTITSPVRISSNSGSPEKVAFDLAEKIAFHAGLKSEAKNEKYWLTLYRKCYKATSGYALEEILKED